MGFQNYGLSMVLRGVRFGSVKLIRFEALGFRAWGFRALEL